MAQSQDSASTGPVAEAPNPAAPAESLAKANQELETLRAEYERLRLQTEALGLAGLKPELRPLQERLLAAVSDYRIADRRAHASLGVGDLPTGRAPHASHDACEREQADNEAEDPESDQGVVHGLPALARSVSLTRGI